LALADQAVVSGASFVTTVLIGRWTSPTQLGFYSIGISLLVSLVTVQDSLVARPYAIQRYRPQGTPAEHAGASLTHSSLLSALAIVAAPGTRHVGLSNGGGSLAVARNGQAVLLLSDLAQAPSGKTYEAWVIGRGRGAAPAGLFHGGRLAIIRLTKPVGNGDSVAVTVERSGGTAKPTHAPILTAPPGSA